MMQVLVKRHSHGLLRMQKVGACTHQYMSVVSNT
jgi:hypothetical protein